jgi:hypothetical protein
MRVGTMTQDVYGTKGSLRTGSLTPLQDSDLDMVGSWDGNDVATGLAIAGGGIIAIMGLPEAALVEVETLDQSGGSGGRDALWSCKWLVHRRGVVVRTSDRCLGLLWWSGSVDMDRLV